MFTSAAAKATRASVHKLVPSFNSRSVCIVQTKDASISCPDWLLSSELLSCQRDNLSVVTSTLHKSLSCIQSCVCVCQLGQYIPRLHSVQCSNLITLANCSDLPQPDSVLSSVRLTATSFCLFQVSTRCDVTCSFVLSCFFFLLQAGSVREAEGGGYPDRIKSRKRRRAAVV